MNSDAVVYFADRYDSEKPTSVHSHNGTEIILVVHGECVNVLPGKEQHAKAGSVIVVPAGMSHRQLNSGRVTTVYVIFEAQQECFDCSARILDVKGDRYAPGWFEQIVSLKTARLDREADRLLGVLLSYLTGRENRLQREGGVPRPPRGRWRTLRRTTTGTFQWRRSRTPAASVQAICICCSGVNFRKVRWRA